MNEAAGEIRFVMVRLGFELFDDTGPTRPHRLGFILPFVWTRRVHEPLWKLSSQKNKRRMRRRDAQLTLLVFVCFFPFFSLRASKGKVSETMHLRLDITFLWWELKEWYHGVWIQRFIVRINEAMVFESSDLRRRLLLQRPPKKEKF